MSGGGYIKQPYAMIPVKLSLLLIFAAWSRFVQPEKKHKKKKNNKSNLDKQFYSTKPQKKKTLFFSVGAAKL